jgi:hypothetical protein
VTAVSNSLACERRAWLSSHIADVGATAAMETVISDTQLRKVLRAKSQYKHASKFAMKLHQMLMYSHCVTLLLNFVSLLNQQQEHAAVIGHMVHTLAESFVAFSLGTQVPRTHEWFGQL